MSREMSAKSVRILYIGRLDPNHETLWAQLHREGTKVEFASTQQAGHTMALASQPQIVVINTTNGRFSGERLCRTLGRRLPSTLRLLISEAGASVDAPCEMRLNRPFTVRKLREAVFKLLEQALPNLLRAGPFQLDLVSRILTGPNGKQHLTPKQCGLLTVLMRHPNQVISRKSLMEQIWDTEYLGDTRTLDVHVRWLREKIEPVPTHPTWLLTRRGVGYMLQIPELDTPSKDPAETD